MRDAAPTDWQTDHPDWADEGRRVVVQMPDGSIAEGQLKIEDTGCDGADEYPIFMCTREDATPIDFYGAKRWRFA